MDLRENRKNTLEYLKEFQKSIPQKKSLFNRKSTPDTSRLDIVKDKISLFYEKGVLISPMLIDKNSIEMYQDTLHFIKQFPQELQAETMLESDILESTKNFRNTRKVLLPSVRQQDAQIMEKYENMVAYYLLMGGANPVQRFSRVEMSMKQYGITPDIGVAIMKYGDDLTSKLEDLASSKVKSPKEWECFKTQVLHCFAVAEKIGNRSVNLAEHMNWEDRLVRLGILEKRRDTEKKQENSLRDSVKYDVRNSGGKDDKSEAKAMVSLESALQKNAEQLYMNTGMVPIGYKKDANGKIVRISPKLETGSNTDRLSASRNNLSATAKKEEQRLQR